MLAGSDGVGGHPGHAGCNMTGMGILGSCGWGQTPRGSLGGPLGCFGQGVPYTDNSSQPGPVAALGCATLPCAVPRCPMPHHGVGPQPRCAVGPRAWLPFPLCRCRERGSVRPAAPLAGADVWLPGMKGLFRRASTLPAPGNRSRGGQPAAGHTMPLCARHLGRPPCPPATVLTPGVQPG